jgi:hypothetical protein
LIKAKSTIAYLCAHIVQMLNSTKIDELEGLSAGDYVRIHFMSTEELNFLSKNWHHNKVMFDDIINRFDNKNNTISTYFEIFINKIDSITNQTSLQSYMSESMDVLNEFNHFFKSKVLRVLKNYNPTDNSTPSLTVNLRFGEKNQYLVAALHLINEAQNEEAADLIIKYFDELLFKNKISLESLQTFILGDAIMSTYAQYPLTFYSYKMLVEKIEEVTDCIGKKSKLFSSQINNQLIKNAIEEKYEKIIRSFHINAKNRSFNIQENNKEKRLH